MNEGDLDGTLHNRINGESFWLYVKLVKVEGKLCDIKKCFNTDPKPANYIILFVCTRLNKDIPYNLY